MIQQTGHLMDTEPSPPPQNKLVQSRIPIGVRLF
jgi:hypothetical protein